MSVLGSVLSDSHTVLAWVAIVGNAIAGVWALAAHKAEGLRSSALWWFTGVVEVLLFVQVAFGVAMISIENRAQPEDFHMFYGFVALATVGIIYSYRHQLKDHMYLLYGFGGLFLMGLGLRAIVRGEASPNP